MNKLNLNECIYEFEEKFWDEIQKDWDSQGLTTEHMDKLTPITEAIVHLCAWKAAMMWIQDAMNGEAEG